MILLQLKDLIRSGYGTMAIQEQIMIFGLQMMKQTKKNIIYQHFITNKILKKGKAKLENGVIFTQSIYNNH